jgi:hypothetical protein
MSCSEIGEKYSFSDVYVNFCAYVKRNASVGKARNGTMGRDGHYCKQRRNMALICREETGRAVVSNREKKRKRRQETGSIQDINYNILKIACLSK